MSRKSGVGPPFDGQPRLPQHALQHPDVGLGVEQVDHQAHVVAGGHLGVAGHVPCGRPAQRAGKDALSSPIASVDRHQRSRVEADLGVGQVVVVDQNQIGPRAADEFGDLGACSDDVEFDPVGAVVGPPPSGCRSRSRADATAASGGPQVPPAARRTT